MKVICERALNFEKIVFYLLVLLLPTQFGKHFWPSFSQVLGIRVDYLSPTLYITDLLIIAIFFFWFKRQSKFLISLPAAKALFGACTNSTEKLQSKLRRVISRFSFLLFIIYLLLNIALSGNFFLGLYGFAKVLELFFLGCYVLENIKTKKDIAVIALIFSITVIGESLLAIAQYSHQGSLNGVLYFLGERRFTSMTPGIANASINGELILRPYGTFPHPNVLAGFLLCSLIFIFVWFESQKDLIKKLLKIIALLFGSIALFLTLSRIAILLWFILAAIIGINWLLMLYNLVIPSEERVEASPRSGKYSWGKSHTTKLGKKVFLLDILDALRSLRLGRLRRPAVGTTLRNFLTNLFFIATTITGLIIFTPILPRLIGTNFTEEAISQRADLFKSTLTMIKDDPLFGVGLLNFLPSLSHIQKPLSPTLYLQPVHNIFLLITAEIGIIGLVFFLWFLFKTYSRLIFCLKNQKNLSSARALLILLSVVLALGLVDHYWLTLQQGQLLLALILGLCWAL